MPAIVRDHHLVYTKELLVSKPAVAVLVEVFEDRPNLLKIFQVKIKLKCNIFTSSNNTSKYIVQKKQKKIP